MNYFLKSPLKSLNNKRMTVFFQKNKSHIKKLNRETSFYSINKLVKSENPLIYGKIGTTELLAVEFSERRVKMNWPKSLSWRRQAHRLFLDSGVFPPTIKQFELFIKTYKESLLCLDGILLWQQEKYLKEYEKRLANDLCSTATRLDLGALMPFQILGELASLRWLIVSPFIATMQNQVSKLDKVFKCFSWGKTLQNVYRTCKFVKSPFFSYLEKTPYNNWSEGLDKITENVFSHIDDFDVAFIGAGAWSLPLLARIKKAGRKGIHFGGSTQLIFGIKGRRWDSYWGQYYNESWVRPLPEDTPEGHMRKEDGCYW
jgi:hypothetical protein